MKKIITKIFLLTFAFWFFSLWLNFVYWQVYHSVGNPSQCANLPPHSVNSTNWTTYATTPNSPYQWYINNSSAINLATANTQWPNVCEWNVSYVWDNIEVSWWKQDFCKNNLNTLTSHQNSLFNVLKTAKSNNYNFWFGSHDQVRNLQSIMKEVNCQNHTDCKLWVVTITNFLFCKVCSSINTSWKELQTFDPKTCETWYILTDDQLCCQPKVACKAPTWTINWETTTNKTLYNSSDILSIVVNYSNNTIGWITFDSSKIQVDWWTIWNIIPNLQTKTISFTVTPDANAEQIKIDVESWCGILEWDLCPWVSHTLHLDVPCQDKKNRASCINFNEFWLTWWSLNLSVLDKSKCELPWHSDSLDFCTWCNDIYLISCQEDYWSWWYEHPPWCCVKCWQDQTRWWTWCICDLTKDCNKQWYTRNEETCRCECDPSKRCCGIELNTVVPFIWDCIEMTTQNNLASPYDPNTSRVNQLNAFPFLMMWLTKILVTLILVFSFLIVIVSWVMMVTWVYDESNYKKWMDRIKKVVVALILLWSSWLILKLINPTFFGG